MRSPRSTSEGLARPAHGINLPAASEDFTREGAEGFGARRGGVVERDRFRLHRRFAEADVFRNHGREKMQAAKFLFGREPLHGFLVEIHVAADASENDAEAADLEFEFFLQVVEAV